MDSWRRRKNEKPNQGGMKMRSPQSGKPPLGNWKPTVPTWEKKFCWEVARIPWRKLVETQTLLHTYENLVKWDDSAAEEAFHNAKERYWAGINGLPYNTPVPDPNAHIDDVDWDSNIDPELILDLDRDFVVSDDSNDGERVLILGEDYAKSQGLTKSGWGDEEDDEVKLTDAYLDKLRRPPHDVGNVWVDHGGGWDNENPWESKVKENDDEGKNEWGAKVEETGNLGEDGWGSKVENRGNLGEYGWGSKVEETDILREDGWGAKVEETGNLGEDGWGAKVEETGNVGENGWNCNSKWKHWENKINSFGSNHWEDGGYKSKHKESSGGYASRYKTTRFHGNDRVNNQWGSHRSGDKFGNTNNNWNNNNGIYRESKNMSRYHTTRYNGDDLANNQWERKNRYGRTRDDLVRDQNRPIN